MYGKFLIATSAMTMALALPAAAQDVDWSAELAQHQGTNLSVSTITDPFIDSMQRTVPAFTKLTGANVAVEGFGYDALHDRQLLGCSQNDGSTDVLVIDGIWMGEFVEAGCLEPLEDRLAAAEDLIQWDDFTPTGAAQASWDGQRYCTPIGIYYGLMFYRTDLFEQAGIEVPTTLDQLKQAAAFFSNNPDYPGVFGYAMNNQRGAAAGQQYFEWIFSAGGSPWASNTVGTADAYADLTPTMNDAASVNLVQFFRDMVQYGPPGVESYAWDERATGFANGSLAMINDWSVRAQIANDPATSQIAGKFAAALMPHAEGGQTVSPVGGWVMCMNAHGAQKEAAWDFIKCSMSGLIVNRPQFQSNYNSSKAAVHHLTKSLAAEWAGRGVRVNAVAPTYIETPLTMRGHATGMAKDWIRDTPMGRLGQVEEVASAVHFLASDASSLMTGAIVVTDAGLTLW